MGAPADPVVLRSSCGLPAQQGFSRPPACRAQGWPGAGGPGAGGGWGMVVRARDHSPWNCSGRRHSGEAGVGQRPRSGLWAESSLGKIIPAVARRASWYSGHGDSALRLPIPGPPAQPPAPAPIESASVAESRGDHRHQSHPSSDRPRPGHVGVPWPDQFCQCGAPVGNTRWRETGAQTPGLGQRQA